MKNIKTLLRNFSSEIETINFFFPNFWLFFKAYGIWNPGEENSNDIPCPRDLKIVEEGDPEDEDEDVTNEEDNRDDQVNILFFKHIPLIGGTQQAATIDPGF